ncbi:hypothetical protein EDC44_11274 [Cricetibacter osteomyelitidis]|uniref:Uncharacterized protein n=1 Tax=Cricetibacter osteomyelitidis TaxID=1521931 RepID=A0A4R2SZN1_9PAST|nr:hypothetical protein [Cricetibacter osteomyelitidis]TCP95015.1 hypothetical protein EDC44_11274 [Cricetibacter osteomyelitidis]
MKRPRYWVFFTILLISSKLYAESRSIVQVDFPIFSCLSKKDDRINLELSQQQNGGNELIFTHYERNGDLRYWFNEPIGNAYQEKYMNGSQLYISNKNVWFKFYDLRAGSDKQIGVVIIDKSSGYQVASLDCVRDTISRLPFLKKGLFQPVIGSVKRFFENVKH